ncbi:hypothetical protein GXW82_17420 [Streptacidiphilus sp. 4-A2]|nr:hypothetical protein [Streptacidiphilus sp. 4-A2]
MAALPAASRVPVPTGSPWAVAESRSKAMEPVYCCDSSEPLTGLTTSTTKRHRPGTGSSAVVDSEYPVPVTAPCAFSR